MTVDIFLTMCLITCWNWLCWSYYYFTQIVHVFNRNRLNNSIQNSTLRFSIANLFTGKQNMKAVTSELVNRVMNVARVCSWSMSGIWVGALSYWKITSCHIALTNEGRKSLRILKYASGSKSDIDNDQTTTKPIRERAPHIMVERFLLPLLQMVKNNWLYK